MALGKERVSIPINAVPYLTSEVAGNAVDGGILKNGYINDKGHKTTRAGFTEHVDLMTGDSVLGTFWSETLQLFLATSSGKLFKVDATPTATDLTGVAPNTGTPAIFTEDNTRAFVVNGGRILYTDGSANTLAITNGIAPSTATHAVFFHQHIISNDTSSTVNSRRIKWSNVGDSLTWDSTNFATAEAYTDKVVALHTITDTLLVFGTQSLELWRATGVGSAPFSRRFSYKAGTPAAYSVAIFEDDAYFLDANKYVRKLSKGTELTYISVPSLDNVLQGFGTVADAKGFIEITEDTASYVLTFPTEGRTFSFDLKSQTWSENTYWDNELSEDKEYLGHNSAYSAATGFNVSLIGSRNSGQLFKVTNTANQDDGRARHFDVQMGAIDHAASENKRSHAIHLRINRGEGVTDATHTPTMIFQHRKEGSKTWSNPKDISLGKQGQRNIFVTIPTNIRYRAVEYRFRTFEAVKIVIGGAYEEVRKLYR